MITTHDGIEMISFYEEATPVHHKTPIMQSFGVFLVSAVCLNKQLNKQLIDHWFVARLSLKLLLLFSTF